MPMKLFLILAGAAVAVAVVGAGAWYWFATNVERPEYETLAKDGAFEVRRYPALVVAEATVSGDREEGVRQGFRRLADYIFAKDRSPGSEDEKIAMTSPVTQQPAGAVGQGEKIAMTSPVTQQPAGDGGGTWRVHFIMPSQYDLDDLPAPGSEAVALRTVPARRVAAVEFSGSWSDENFRRHAEELQDWMAAQGLQPAGPPIYAYYNDPFTPAFLRRNEVIVELAGE
jgi:DNA gyrase inhibitor GyrI